MNRVFNKDETFSPEAMEIEQEIYAKLEPIIKKYLSIYYIHDLELIAHHAVSYMGLLLRLEKKSTLANGGK